MQRGFQMTIPWITRLGSWHERAMQTPIVGSLLRSSFWSIVGAMIARVLGLLAWMAVARLLGRTAFGELGIVQNTTGVLQNLCVFGLGLMATRYVSEHRSVDAERAGRVIGLSILLAALSGVLVGGALYALSSWVARVVLVAPHLKSVLGIGCILIAVYAVIGVMEGALAGLDAFRDWAGLNLVMGVFALPIYGFGAWRGGLVGVMWASVVVAVVVAVVSFGVLHRAAVRKNCPIRFGRCWTEIRAFVDFSMPVTVAAQTYFMGDWLGGWLLVRQPGGYAEMGLYNAAARWQQAVSFIPLHVRRAVFPALTDRYAAGDRKAFAQMLRYYILVSTGLAALCAVGLSLLSRFVMSGYGAEFVQGWPVLVVVSLTMVLQPVRWAMEMIYRTTRTVWYEFLMNLLWVATMLLGMALIPAHGSMRLALSVLLAFVVSTTAAGVHVYFRWLRGATRGVAS